jgi:hypothetical protein
MTAILAPPLIFQGVGQGGLPLPFGKLFSYVAGTSTPQATYTDSTQTTSNPNPLILNANGQAPLWLDPTKTYKFILQDALTNQTYVTDQVSGGLNASAIGSNLLPALNNTYNIGSPGSTWANGYFGTSVVIAGTIVATFPQLTSETNTSVIANTAYSYGDMRRYGVVPNSIGAAATNSAALQALFNPSVANGPTGLFWFPNVSGSDVYTFSGVIPIRPGVILEGNGCTVSYIGTGVSADSNSGLFFALQDFECRNFNFISTFNTGVATSCGQVINIGARGADSPRWPVAVWDSLLPTPMGNIRLKNLRITMNLGGTPLAAGSSAISLTAGLQGVIIEDVYINGSGTLGQGIVQEFGWATSDTQPSARQSSHMHNFSFKNIQITNMVNSGTAVGGIILAGAYQGTIENYSFASVASGVICSTGESMFFRPWAGVDDIAGKRTVTLRNITGTNTAVSCLNLSGSQSRVAGPGYLQRQWVTATNYGVRETVINGGNMYVCTIGGTSGAGPSGTGTGIADGSVTWNYVPLTVNTDQIDYIVDGFALNPNSTADGIDSSAGYISIKNGTISGGNNPIFFFPECTRFDIEGIRASGGQVAGLELASTAGAIWSPVRLKKGSIRDCYIYANSAASTGAQSGIHLDNCEGVMIENNRINADVNYNGVAEITQGTAIQIGSNAFGVSARFNHIGNIVGGGNLAYFSGAATASLNGNDIVGPLGVLTQSSNWNTNGVGNATTANISSKTSNINTIGKLFGRAVFNSSNNRLLISTGPNNTDNWAYCDGNAPGTITPA